MLHSWLCSSAQQKTGAKQNKIKNINRSKEKINRKNLNNGCAPTHKQNPTARYMNCKLEKMK